MLFLSKVDISRADSVVVIDIALAQARAVVRFVGAIGRLRVRGEGHGRGGGCGGGDGRSRCFLANLLRDRGFRMMVQL